MRQVLKGSVNISVDVYIIDSTTGVPETGVLFNTAGIDLEYRREGAVVTNITEVTLAALTTAHADGGFLEVGHGLYRLDIPDAAFATGASTVSIQGTVTGMIVLPQTIQLVDFDPEDSVRLGLTALPNAAADAAGGLPISDAGGLNLDAMNTNINDIETDTNELQADWVNGGRLDLLLDAIPTTAMRGTDSAALASVCTETRLSELDAATGGKMANQVDVIQTDTTTDIPALLPSALVGGRMDSDVGAKTGNVALSAQEKLDVNVEALDVLVTDTHVESSGVPAATSSLKDKIVWLFTLSRNKGTQTSTTKTLRNDADDANIASSTITDDATTFTRNEWL